MKTLLTLLALTSAISAAPIALHPENSHYFLFRDKPTALIMKPDNTVVALGLPEKIHARALVAPNKAIAVYLHGDHAPSLQLNLSQAPGKATGWTRSLGSAPRSPRPPEKPPSTHRPIKPTSP